MTIRTLRGMNDILPSEIPLWQGVEEAARRLFSLYNYEEIRTPLVEELSLFSRTIGENTPIVEKEMYSLEDGEKLIALRPEGTASVVRAYIESGRAVQEPIARYYYIGPMYRKERPQKGRLREFHQIGLEAFGVASPLLDAELIHMTVLFFKEVGITNFEIEVNSLGCPICRPVYHKKFLEFLEKNRSHLCAECQRRIEKNPLRVLDCKEEACRKITEKAPSIQDHLCEACERDFDLVLETLGRLGNTYQVNPRIVRGLDYYTKTTFEITTLDLGAQNALAGGGRYDGLVRLLGGPNIPAVGCAIGMERMIELLQNKKMGEKIGNRMIFIAPLGEKGLKEAMLTAQKLRKEGWRVEMDYDGKSLKSQMRRADKSGSRYVLILGEEELKKGKIVLRNLESKEQQELPFSEIATRFQKGANTL